MTAGPDTSSSNNERQRKPHRLPILTSNAACAYAKLEQLAGSQPLPATVASRGGTSESGARCKVYCLALTTDSDKCQPEWPRPAVPCQLVCCAVWHWMQLAVQQDGCPPPRPRPSPHLLHKALRHTAQHHRSVIVGGDCVVHSVLQYHLLLHQRYACAC